jgi:threonine synthase
MAASALTTLGCSRCSGTHDPDRVQHLCSCGAPLLARYDLAVAAKSLSRDSLAHRAHDLWRFRELLPVRDDEAIVSLGERPSPVLRLRRTSESVDVAELYCKDEAALPTGSFKARGAAVGISRARELGVHTFAMPSNGNAGSAWSLYAARAGMRAIIAMPVLAPAIHRLQCVLAGAKVVLVDGLITDAGRLVARAVAREGWYDASTLKEPYRIEGKKTLGFEIAEQFAWNLPDVIVYPTGGGVGLIGMHKAFRELQAIGLLGERLPRFVAVQASGCAPIVKAFREGQETSAAWDGASTVAFGINVPKAIGDFLILRILNESRGAAIAVNDDEILEYQRQLIEQEGVLACPEGGATLAAVAQLRRDQIIGVHERVLIINTGSGALYPDIVCPPVETIGADGELRITFND